MPLLPHPLPDAWSLPALCERLAPFWPGISAQCLPTIDSTNLELQRRWRAGQRHPQLLLAEAQTAGRGRLGRQWHSQPGASLTFSLALPVVMRDWSGLSLVVGLAVAESLHPRLGLKWPNDVWLMDAPQTGRKVGGILLESVSNGAASPDAGAKGGAAYTPQPGLLVIGVGLNVAEQVLEDGQAVSVAPACLQELLPQTLAAQVLHTVVPAIAQALAQFESSGFAPFRSRFTQRDVLVGGPLALSDGRIGSSAGVDLDGALLLQTDQGLIRVLSGEVSVRPVAGQIPGHLTTAPGRTLC